MSSSPRNPLDPLPQELKGIQGLDKLSRQIQKELKSPAVNQKCSNLPHLLSILKSVRDLSSSSKVSAVLKPFTFSKGTSGRLVIDIVSPDGDGWYKVSARNPKSITQVASGGGEFGQKSIIDHVQDYLDCASENPCLFKVPKVTVIFTSGISESVAAQVEEMGAYVQGERIADDKLGITPRIKGYEYECEEKLEASRDSDCYKDAGIVLGHKNPSLEGVKRLNLDITALIAYPSNLTNGHFNVPFTTKILAHQAAEEKVRPQKPLFDKIFEGRELVCCETAMKEFQWILSTVGGEEEKMRAAEFLQRVTVVPDRISERVKGLRVSANVKERSLVIFGTGDCMEAVTVTANSGFVRSAQSQGVELAVFLHESRALTEQKEQLVNSKS